MIKIHHHPPTLKYKITENTRNFRENKIRHGMLEIKREKWKENKEYRNILGKKWQIQFLFWWQPSYCFFNSRSQEFVRTKELAEKLKGWRINITHPICISVFIRWKNSWSRPQFIKIPRNKTLSIHILECK